MTDAVLVFPPGFRVLDADGAPLSGAKLKFYAAGTTTTRTVYSDSGLSSSLGSTVYTGSDGFPVASSGSSTAVKVYTGTTAYKIIITDENDVTLLTLDNIAGALDTSTYLTTSSTSTLSIPITTKSADYTIVSGDRGKCIQCNPTGGNFTLTLTTAATLGDGWNIELRNSGTSGQFILSSPEAVAFEGGSFTLRAFEIGECVSIRCDGVAFKVISHTPPRLSPRSPGIICIADRVSAAPSSPTPGARYIVTGAFSTYSVGDIIEANGTGFNAYTPLSDGGWLAYVQDENAIYQFQDSAWVPLSATQAQMEAASSGVVFATPSTVGYHPGVLKAWGEIAISASTPSISASQNVSSVTDNGAGDTSANFSTAFSGSAFGSAVTGHSASGSGFLGMSIFIHAKATTSLRVKTFQATTTGNTSNAAVDNLGWSFVASGDQ